MWSAKYWFFLTAALVGLALYAGAAAAQPEPPDYPADKCVFMQPIPYDEPIDPYSDSLINTLAKHAHYRSIRLRLGEWTMSIYWINGTNYQLEDVYTNTGFCPMGYWVRDVPFPTDQNVVACDDTDANTAFIDPVHNMEYNFWAITQGSGGEWVRNASGYYECKNAGAVFTSTSGSNPVGCSMRGPSIAHSIGMVLPGQLAAGQVYHALDMCYPSDPGGGTCPPATYNDSTDRKPYPQRLPESAVFRLKPSIWTDQAIENATRPDGTPWHFTEKVMAKAARDYGIYITDYGGAADLYANNFNAYPSDPYLDIDGCRIEQRTPSGNYTHLWGDDFLSSANFEVLDRCVFPYPKGDRWLDYDGDGITNAAETSWGYRDSTLYLEHNDPSNGPLDWDNDGLTNSQECALRSNFRYLPLSPFDSDSDGDGYTDYEEANDWSADPTDPFVTPDPAWPGMPVGPNLALGKPVSSSFGSPQNATDGDEDTFCGGGPNTGYVEVDLQSVMDIGRVIVKWDLNGHYYGSGWNVEVSTGGGWTPIRTEDRGTGGLDDCYTWSGQARYVRLNVTECGGPWGPRIRELEVYGAGGPVPPVADFVGNPTSGDAPLDVYFTDLSSGSPTSWDWTFGDGGSSAAQHPSHTYTSGGQYTVSLEACNSAGCDTETKPNYIDVTELQPPVADFVGDPTSGNAPLEVDFTDLSTNSPTSWSWTFGDGGSSGAQHPSHTYATADSYTVSLEACNGAGCDTETKVDYITVTTGQPPVADFVGDPTSGPVPLTVDFTDLSTNSPTSWDWAFGDTGTSSLQNPSHQYTGTGQFTVSLTAANAYGQDTETKQDYITVTVAPPVADFVGDPTSGPVPLTVDFTDLSTNNPTSWDWAFGDTGTSSLQNPSHQYTGTGQFTVSLTAANAGGEDTETKTNYITVTDGGGGDYTAYDYDIVYGTYVSGTIADTHASDDSYLVVDTVRVTGNQATQIQYYIATDLSSLSSLSVTQEWRHQGAPAPQRQRTRLYNFASSGWVEVDNREVDCTNDTTITFDVANPAPYLSATGEVHVQFWCGDAGKTAFSHYIDLVKITAAP